MGNDQRFTGRVALVTGEASGIGEAVARRPHEQGRAAIEFYTELVTVYQDAPLA